MKLSVTKTRNTKPKSARWTNIHRNKLFSSHAETRSSAALTRGSFSHQYPEVWKIFKGCKKTGNCRSYKRTDTRTPSTRAVMQRWRPQTLTYGTGYSRLEAHIARGTTPAASPQTRPSGVTRVGFEFWFCLFLKVEQNCFINNPHFSMAMPCLPRFTRWYSFTWFIIFQLPEHESTNCPFQCAHHI